MTAAPPLPAATVAALAVYFVALLAERLGELWLSRRNLARLAARGAVESHAGHFWMFVVLHSAYPVALVAEVLAVALEFVAAPLMFGAWRCAGAFSALNALAMAVRVPAEERALREAERKNPAPGLAPGP